MTDADRARLAAWILTGLALPLILVLHLLPALLGGLLVYELIHVLAPLLAKRLPPGRAHLAAFLLLSVLIVAAVTAGVLLTLAFFRSDIGSLPALVQKMADILEGSRQSLPEWIVVSLPDNADDLKAAIVQWLRDHAAEVQLAGKEMIRGLVHVFVGTVIGAIMALREVTSQIEERPLAHALAERARRLADAFRRIVFAQVRISAINTCFTALYLLVALPLLGVHLPFASTLVAITFVVGLLPVVGNLVSNSIIVVVSLAHSPQVAISSLVFLVVIHKLEYFLNARIVGSQIAARAWELLLAMLVMEAAFGIPGVVAAPIYYAYLKRELSDAGWV
jgi:predicted PurR-regulated permease PerM